MMDGDDRWKVGRMKKRKKGRMGRWKVGRKEG